MGNDGLVSDAKISAALHGDDSAMDDIPLFSPAGAQAWRAYHYHYNRTALSRLPSSSSQNLFLDVRGGFGREGLGNVEVIPLGTDASVTSPCEILHIT